VTLYVGEIESLRTQEAALQVQAQDEDVKKKIETMEKQIETLTNLVKLLAKQIEKQPGGGPVVEQLQEQAATLEARSVQAARRDVELANARRRPTRAPGRRGALWAGSAGPGEGIVLAERK